MSSSLINADEIEGILSTKGFLNLDDYGLQLSQIKFEKYLAESPFAVKAIESGLGVHLRLQENVLVSTSSKSNSYEAAFIAELLHSFLSWTGAVWFWGFAEIKEKNISPIPAIAPVYIHKDYMAGCLYSIQLPA